MNFKVVLKCACNFSFPECEADALLVEVQDKKNSVHGRATIPVSSLTDNPVCIPYSISSIGSFVENIYHFLPSGYVLNVIVRLFRMTEFDGGPFTMMIKNALERSNYRLVVQSHLTRLTI